MPRENGKTFRSPVVMERMDFEVEWIINVDERGHWVLPKELREKANIRAGDKLAVIR